MSDDEWMIGYQMEYDEPNDLCRQVSQSASQPARLGQFEEHHQALDEQQQSYEDRKRQFKWAVFKFMSNKEDSMDTKFFQFEELKNSKFLSNFSEDDIKYIKQQNSGWIMKDIYIIWTKEKVAV